MKYLALFSISFLAFQGQAHATGYCTCIPDDGRRKTGICEHPIPNPNGSCGTGGFTWGFAEDMGNRGEKRKEATARALCEASALQDWGGRPVSCR